MKNILPAMLRHHDFTVNSKCKNIVSKYSDAKSGPANGRREFTYMCTTCLSDAIIIYLNYSFSLTQQPPI